MENVAFSRKFAFGIALFCAYFAAGFTQSAGAQEEKATDDTTSTKTKPAMRDRIVLGPAKPASIEQWQSLPHRIIVGEVLAFDAEKLIVTDSTGSPTEMETARVVGFHPHWASDKAREMDQLFRQGDSKGVAKLAKEVINSPIPPWQQRMLVAQTVESAFMLGNKAEACQLFISLCDSKPPLMLYGYAPLNWVEFDIPAPLQTSAEKWLNDSRPAASLLGASWLLSGSKRGIAKEKLQQLQQNPNPAIADLATAQLWRIEPISPKSQELLVQWQDRRDQMPIAWQVGPTELIADRWQSAGKNDVAITELVRIAVLHADRYDRATQARQQAASLLSREGREAEAAKLLKKVN